MYNTSIYFIKGQVPKATLTILLNQYKIELQDQHVTSIDVVGHCIVFSNSPLNVLPRNYGNQFSYFSKGTIEIEEREKEYIVKLSADASQLFILPGVFAVVVLVLFSLNGGLSAGVLLIALVAFLLALIPRAIGLYVYFPVYFDRLRNNIEQRLA